METSLAEDVQEKNADPVAAKLLLYVAVPQLQHHRLF